MDDCFLQVCENSSNILNVISLLRKNFLQSKVFAYGFELLVYCYAQAQRRSGSSSTASDVFRVQNAADLYQSRIR